MPHINNDIDFRSIIESSVIASMMEPKSVKRSKSGEFVGAEVEHGTVEVVEKSNHFLITYTNSNTNVSRFKIVPALMMKIFKIWEGVE